MWVIGHSLGGALASLLGATFGAPVVTFESPGEKMAASRLHLPSPVSSQYLLVIGLIVPNYLKAFNTPHHPHLSLCRPNCDGYLQRYIVFMCSCRICNGNQVLLPTILPPFFESLNGLFYSCHLGKTIFYDTVSNLSWSVDIRTHGIVTVIDKILSEPWGPSVDIGREVPEAKFQDECVVSAMPMLCLLGIRG